MLIDDVISSFQRVLTHRKIQAEIRETVPIKWGNGKQFDFIACGKTYTMAIRDDKKFVYIAVQYKVGDFVRSIDSWPIQFFSDKFLKSTPDRIRKSALIFRKKLELKPVYDLLQA